MKKPTRKHEAAPRLLKPSQLDRIRGGDGGGSGSDNWEAPIAGLTGNKVWQDDWLAPT
jgi:hypothetical protein